MAKGTINWLLLFTVLLLAYYSLRGGKVGFIRTIFSMFSIIIAIVAASVFSPYVSKSLQENRIIMEKVQGDKSEDIGSSRDSSWSQLITDLVKGSPEATSKLQENAKDYIMSEISQFIINTISFIGIFIIIRLILAFFCGALDVVSKIPVLNGLNKTAGFLAGFLHGLLNVWIVFAVITIFSRTELGVTLFQYIESSKILTTIYSQNILLKIFI